jgi:hypothetical protein
MQPVVVIVDGKKTRHVVIVYEGDEVFFPGEVAAFLRQDRINLGEVCVRCEDVANRSVEREVQK